jgi:glycosyltransferase involved in cell wall biosynthesis
MEHIKKIQLLIATGLYPPEIGGPATYVSMLERRLPEHGFSLAIVPYSRVRSLPKFKRHLAYARELWRHADGADAIYALDPISVGLPALLVCVLKRKPLFVRLGGDYAWEQGQQRFGLNKNLDEYTRDRTHAPWQVKLLSSLQSFLVKRAKVVIAPSEYLKGIIVSWGVDSEKVHVIYSALSSLSIDAPKSDLRTELSYEGKVISTAGRLVPWKGIHELIDVFSVLQKDIPDLFLTIIGDGPEEAALKAHVERLSLERKVRFAGKLSKTDLGKAVKGSDVFVLNSSYEGLSHQLLEVMQLGVPIVASDVGGNPELIHNEVSGLLVPNGDREALREAIRRIIENDALGLRLSQTARVRVQHFTEDEVLVHLVKLLKSSL